MSSAVASSTAGSLRSLVLHRGEQLCASGDSIGACSACASLSGFGLAVASMTASVVAASVVSFSTGVRHRVEASVLRRSLVGMRPADTRRRRTVAILGASFALMQSASLRAGGEDEEERFPPLLRRARIGTAPTVAAEWLCTREVRGDERPPAAPVRRPQARSADPRAALVRFQASAGSVQLELSLVPGLCECEQSRSAAQCRALSADVRLRCDRADGDKQEEHVSQARSLSGRMARFNRDPLAFRRPRLQWTSSLAHRVISHGTADCRNMFAFLRIHRALGEFELRIVSEGTVEIQFSSSASRCVCAYSHPIRSPPLPPRFSISPARPRSLGSCLNAGVASRLNWSLPLCSGPDDHWRLSGESEPEREHRATGID